MDGLEGYELHFTAFIDLLGFAEASPGGDAFTRAKVLNFLLSISSTRGEFDFQSRTMENGTTIQIRPTISTSYPATSFLGSNPDHRT